jgi:hypothetical protein
VLLQELLGEPLGHEQVPIVATHPRVARGGDHLDDAAAHVEDGHVEGAAAQVEDHHALVVAHVDRVREGRRLLGVESGTSSTLGQPEAGS